MFRAEKISRSFRSGTVETTALRDVSLKVNPGEFVSIMGPSGCGKSTLLNILGTLDRPTSGDFWIKDENVSRYSEAKLAEVRRRHIGFVFQSFNLIDQLTVRENVELALRYRKTGSQERRLKAGLAMERFGIAHRADHRPSQLSGGQQQRVAVARALVTEPDLILADEPTGNLDSHHGEDVMGALKSLNDEGATLVMVTHSPAHASYAGRTIRLFDGEIMTSQDNSVSQSPREEN